MSTTVNLTIDDTIAYVELNRPERLNAINADLLHDFANALRAAQVEPGVEVIILHGAGRAFCAGDDLKDFSLQSASAEEAREFVESIQIITRLLIDADPVVIAAVHGWAVGGGIEWMIGCDLVVLADDTRAFFPEIELGLFITGGASTLLPHLVGLHKAKEMLLLGERYDADELLELGLANRVVPRAELMASAEAMARRIAGLPPTARRNAKHVLNHAFREPVGKAIERETEATLEGLLDPATAERVAGRLTS
jgi:enoyl-CoA hydratase/carnithine racemase